MMAHKVCPRCGRTGDVFTRNRARADGLEVYCKWCRRADYARNRLVNCEAARERAKRRQATYKRGIRKKAIELYGGECACCGETELAFLCLDHIDGGGTKARGRDAYAEMRRAIASYQPEKYQVLCANCNMAKERKEGCPHQQVGHPHYLHNSQTTG